MPLDPDTTLDLDTAYYIEIPLGDIQDEIATLEKKSRDLTECIFSNLKPWQISQVARHPLRPYFLDYVQRIFDDFEEMHGDRAFADDPAIVSGIARLEGIPVAIIGHQKGRDTKEKLHRNFGMPRPEGYRKALRIMQTAERFRLPILTFIDTPGAYPGIGAEERHIAEAIAVNLREMTLLKVPIIAAVIGEVLWLAADDGARVYITATSLDAGARIAVEGISVLKSLWLAEE